MNPAMDTSLEMKSFLILLVLGLGSSDKLDRTYLPPPGSKFSGGSPGAIQVPLELPKETYSTTLRPLIPGQKDRYSPEDLQPTVGIDRGLLSGISTDTSHNFPVTPGSQTPFTYFQDKIPTTTTSYAFTQTTIFPPTEGFETTISPVGPTFFPSPNTINNIQQQTYPQPSILGQREQIGNQFSTGFRQPGDQIRDQNSGLAPAPGTNIQQPGFGLPSPIPGGLPTFGGRIDYNQPIPPDLNQYQQGTRPSLTISSIPELDAQAPIFVPQTTYNKNYSGVQPPRQQGTSPYSAPQAIVPTFRPGISPISGNVQGTIDNIQNIPQTGDPRPIQLGQKGYSSSMIAPQSTSYQSDTSTQLSENLGDIGRTLAPGLKVPQSLFPNQKIPTTPTTQPGSNRQFNQLPFGQNQLQIDDNRSIPGQQFPITTPTKDSSLVSVDSQNIYNPDSISTSSILPPGLSNQQFFPSTTPVSFPFGTTSPSNMFSPSTPVYPGISKQVDLDPTKFIPRPERPQAESDRNSVILNYENVLTPVGFAYTFDTSNGLHADESGTAIDGVKALGSYSYTGDDGKLYSVSYSADENGFQPRGDHLPTPPPIPEAIQRVIDQAVREKEAGVMHDGSYDEGKYGHIKYQERMKLRRPQVKDKMNEYANRILEANNVKPGTKENGIIPIKDDISDKYEDEIEEAPLGVTETDDDTRKLPFGRIPSRRPSNRIKEQDNYKNDSDENKKNIQMNERQKTMGSRTNSRNELPPGRKDFERRPVAPESEQSFKDSQDVDIESFKESRPFEFKNIPSQPLDMKNNLLRPNKLPSQTADKRYDMPVGSITRDSTIAYRPKETKDQYYNRSNRPLPPNVDSYEPSYTPDNDLDSKYRIPDAPINSAQFVTGMTTLPEHSSTRYSDGQRSRPKKPLISQGSQLDNSFGNIPSVGTEIFNKKGRPPSKQRLGPADNKYLYDEQESGYRYIPPKNKFEQGEVNTFPLLFTEDRKGSTTRLPAMQYGPSFNKETNVQPFITPNVSRDNEDVYKESVGQRFNVKKPDKISNDKATLSPSTTQDEYEYSDLDTEQEVSDKRITPTRLRPDRPDSTKTSSTRRPPASNRPQFNVGDIQGDYKPSDQERTSTPGQADYSVHGMNSFSTTAMPFRGPMRFSSTQPQHTTRTQFPATYLPSSSPDSSMYDYSEESTAPGLPTVRPGSSKTPNGTPTPGSVDNYYESTTVPSFATIRPTSIPSGRPTTSRPNSDSRPVISVDPSVLPAVDYSLSSGKPGSMTVRPAIVGIPTSEPITDYFDRTTQTGSITVRPGTSSRLPERPEKFTRPQNLPSTTYRPNYIFTDRVSQPGKRPGEPGKEFRKPIRPEQMGQGFAGSTTYRPDYVSSQDLGLPSTGTYQDTGFRHSSQIPGGYKDGKPDLFGLGQSRFGEPELVLFEGPQSTISPVLGQGSVPSYLGSYGQTSTDRVIGEDFSGPIQPQRFDPKTGYYY